MKDEDVMVEITVTLTRDGILSCGVAYPSGRVEANGVVVQGALAAAVYQMQKHYGSDSRTTYPAPASR